MCGILGKVIQLLTQPYCINFTIREYIYYFRFNLLFSNVLLLLLLLLLSYHYYYITIIIIITHSNFSYQHQLMVFHWSLSDSKSLQISRTLLSILADLCNAVVRMLWARPMIPRSPSLLCKPLEIVSCAPIIIGITVTFSFHIIFSSLAKSICLVSWGCRIH